MDSLEEFQFLPPELHQDPRCQHTYPCPMELEPKVDLTYEPLDLPKLDSQ